MRVEKGVLVCSFLFIILLGVVSAVNECGVKPRSQCTGAWSNVVFEMSSDGNAHVQSPSALNDYQYAFCCNYAGATTCSGSNRIIRMYSNTNTHAEIPDKSPNIYTIDSCYDLSCSSVNANPTSPNYGCTTGNAVLSLSAETNAHAAIQGFYTGTGAKTICCNVATAPRVCSLSNAIWSDSSVPEGKTVTLSVGGSAACSTKSVNFSISQVGGGNVDNINSVSFSGTQTATANWVTKYIGTGTADLKYIFRASLVEDVNTYTDSGELTVQKGRCGDTIIQTNRGEECDKGNQNGVIGSGCATDCKIPFEGAIICVDYEDYQPEPATACNENPSNVGIYTGVWEDYQDLCQRRENGIGCIWNDNGIDGEKCLQDTEYEFHLDNPESCVETQTKCRYIEDPQGSCDGSINIITINYELSALSNDPGGLCKQEYSQTVPCPELSMLPFFGAYQVIISLTIISIIYVLMILGKRFQNPRLHLRAE